MDTVRGAPVPHDQLLPPLTIQEDEVVQVIESLDHMLTWLENRC